MSWPLRRSVYGQLHCHSRPQAHEASHSSHQASSRHLAAAAVVGGSGVQRIPLAHSELRDHGIQDQSQTLRGEGRGTRQRTRFRTPRGATLHDTSYDLLFRGRGRQIEGAAYEHGHFLDKGAATVFRKVKYIKLSKCFVANQALLTLLIVQGFRTDAENEGAPT
eukprot:3262023-Pyramimonas_sp.AAC.1